MNKPSQAPIRRVRRALKRLNPFRRRWKGHVVAPAERPRPDVEFLFVCGLHRSGTTLLETWLRSVCEVSALRAPVPENEGEHLQDVYPRTVDCGGPGRFAFDPAMHLAVPDANQAIAARSRLVACWTPWIKGQEAMLLEKSPSNLTKIAWLRAVFPGSRFIILTRDPRVVAMATQKWSGGTLTDLVYHWHVAHSAALEAMGADCACVSYEEFCRAPEATIDRIASELGLTRREQPLPVPPRFRAVGSSNDRYLRDWPATRLGEGVWTRFGYRLDP